MRMGLREANQHFSKAMRAVKAGQEVVLTERGKPIAVIKPLAPTGDVESRLAALAATGAIRPASKPGPMPDWKPPRVKRGAKPLSVTLREDRDAR